MVKANKTPSMSFNTVEQIAYQSLEGKLSTMTESELVHINTNVRVSIATTMRYLPGLRALKPPLKLSFPSFGPCVELLEIYVPALGHAQRLYEEASASPVMADSLLESARRAREILCADLSAMVNHGLISDDHTRDITLKPGFLNLARDLEAIQAVLSKHWDTVHSNSCLRKDDLQNLFLLIARLHLRLSEGDRDNPELAEAALNRQRVYSLFFRAYDATRRAILSASPTPEHANRLLPSLFAGRGRGGGKRERSAEGRRLGVATVPA